MRSHDSAKTRGKAPEGGSKNSWMTTFSDLVTLLLTFFVLLFSMSSMDSQKLKISFQNFGGSSGLLSFKEYGEITRPKEVLIRGLSQLLGEKVVIGGESEKTEADVDTKDLENLGNYLYIQPLRDGLKLVFGNRLLFPSGGAKIRGEIKPTLDNIARFISVSGSANG